MNAAIFESVVVQWSRTAEPSARRRFRLRIPREAANGEIAVRFPELDGADGDAGGHRMRVARSGDNLERSGFPVRRAAKIMSGHGNRAGDDQKNGDAGGGVVAGLGGGVATQR